MIEQTLMSEDFLNNKKKSLSTKIQDIMSKSDAHILQFFSDYIAWNGVFGGAVAGLTSKWHNAQYLALKMSKKEISGIKKYSHRIASEIFAAAEDEYSDENCKIPGLRISHKDMAWFFLTNMMEFYGEDKRAEVSLHTETYIYRTLHGYGVTATDGYSLEDLIEFVGFHIGSEKIASFEFDYLTSELEASRPDLFDYLSSKVLVEGITAIDWLRFHGTVEEEHFQSALNAADLIKQMVLTHDLMTEDKYNSLLIKGFNKFSNLQDSVFKHY